MARGRVEKTVLGKYSANETFDTGEDTGSPVSDDYKAPFRFGGAIKQVVIDLAPEKLAAADLEMLKKAKTLLLISD